MQRFHYIPAHGDEDVLASTLGIGPAMKFTISTDEEEAHYPVTEYLRSL